MTQEININREIPTPQLVYTSPKNWYYKTLEVEMNSVYAPTYNKAFRKYTPKDIKKALVVGGGDLQLTRVLLDVNPFCYITLIDPMFSTYKGTGIHELYFIEQRLQEVYKSLNVIEDYIENVLGSLDISSYDVIYIDISEPPMDGVDNHLYTEEFLKSFNSDSPKVAYVSERLDLNFSMMKTQLPEWGYIGSWMEV